MGEFFNLNYNFLFPCVGFAKARSFNSPPVSMKKHPRLAPALSRVISIKYQGLADIIVDEPIAGFEQGYDANA